MSNPTILMCIGAPKAGTTWLHFYLKSHPDCHIRAIKELHYFDWRRDSLDRGGPRTRSHRPYLRRQERRLETLRESRGKGIFVGAQKRRLLDAQIGGIEDWLALHRDYGAGHDAYKSYLLAGRTTQPLVADITPCYMTLGASDFREMASLAGDVRFLFLLRDPVDRLWSNLRMRSRRRAEARGSTRDSASFLRDVLDEGDAGILARSDYARTVQALLEAVPREKVSFEFYEDLFQQETLDRLTGFLGIRALPGEFETERNVGQNEALDEAQVQRSLDMLRPQYAFCHEFFKGRLPDRWLTRMQEA